MDKQTQEFASALLCIEKTDKIEFHLAAEKRLLEGNEIYRKYCVSQPSPSLKERRTKPKSREQINAFLIPRILSSSSSNKQQATTNHHSPQKKDTILQIGRAHV